mmetsp:Transcript_67575/g.213950  ORF Transcript_67575/g.213950 Transcript_67575/m.213950 type:complete len:266 (-) Transcript_67575:61-858(-)
MQATSRLHRMIGRHPPPRPQEASMGALPPVVLGPEAVDAHEPIGRGVDLLEEVQLHLPVPDLRLAYAVPPRLLVPLSGHLPEAVVAQLVQEARSHGRRGRAVHPVLPPLHVVHLPDVLREGAAPDAHHPQELCHVIARVPRHAPKHDHDVARSQPAGDAVRLALLRRHRAPHFPNVGRIPRVVINDHRAVAHRADLIPIVPPRHDLSVLGGVVPQPRVSFPEVIEDRAAPVCICGREHDRRRGVGRGGYPRAVLCVECQQEHDAS